MFAGQTAQITCLVSDGDLPLDISWSFQGADNFAHLGISTQNLGRKGSSLLIESADSYHQGNYTCTVKNAAATANYTAALNVHGKIHKHTCIFCIYSPFQSMSQPDEIELFYPQSRKICSFTFF